MVTLQILTEQNIRKTMSEHCGVVYIKPTVQDGMYLYRT